MVAVAESSATSRQAYEPRGGCRDFFLATDPEVLAVGPAGTGKTFAACMRIHLTLLNNPGVRVLMLRKVLEDLKTAALHTYITKVQPERVGVRTFGGNRFYPAEFRYPNGSALLVVGMDKPGKVLSAEYDIIYANEATELSETDWQMLKTRLRNGALPYQMLMGDCNPSGPRHWLNQRCNTGLTRRITTTHKDNPAYWDREKNDWTPLGRIYVQENLATLTGVERARLFEGKWAAAEGLVYTAFGDQHIRKTTTERLRTYGDDADGEYVRPVGPDETDITAWRTILTVDVGTRNPTAIYTLHCSGDERVHISHEVYRRNMSSSDILSAIRERADITGPEMIVIDPSAAGYIADLENDGYPVQKANNDILTGIQRVQAHLVRDGGFSVDPDCTNMIDEFGMYAYPDKSRTETDKPKKEHDHAMDALRYGIAYLADPIDALGVY